MQEKRQQVCGLLTHQATLVELLEVPQLTETCVRSGNYEEALDLISSVAKLSVVHPDIVAVQRLASEVAECRSHLLEQLTAKLSSSVSLPECLRCVSYMRRVAVFSELELRRRFLVCRESWYAFNLPFEKQFFAGCVIYTCERLFHALIH
jgi:hypothetical protein